MAKLIITGNPVDGFEHYGPFGDDVDDYSNTLESVKDEYWIADLLAPGALHPDLEPDEDKPASDAATATCRHCGRTVTQVGDKWVDPEATGDDAIWRESCPDHETFTAEHEPTDPDEILGNGQFID